MVVLRRLEITVDNNNEGRVHTPKGISRTDLLRLMILSTLVVPGRLSEAHHRYNATANIVYNSLRNVTET